MTWPRKIFIESTALFQLGPRVETVDLARLIELRNILGARLYVSEVNWLEYLRFRKRELREVWNRIAQTNKDLAKYGLSLPQIATFVDQFDSFVSQLESYFREKFQSLGIQVLPLPAIDARRLLAMSIDGIPPFERPREQGSERSTEKGFRDALTMFTVFQEIKDGSQDHSLVITGDRLLTESFAHHSEEFKTRVHCADGFTEAIRHIEARISEANRESLRRESDEAKQMLNANRAALDSKIGEIRELSSTDFGGLFGTIKGEDGQTLSIDKVLAVEFQEIESAIWKEAEGATSRVLFRVKCRAKVVASNPYSMFADFPTYLIGGDAVHKLQTMNTDKRETTVPVWFYGHAVFDRAYGDWTLKDLQIDRTTPDPEDIFQLIRLRGGEAT
jgi:hypothetical protein